MSNPFDFEVEIYDPCLLNIAIVTPSTQTNPAPYHYKAPDLAWSISPPFTANYNCQIKYSCINILSPVMPPAFDMCSVIHAETTASFDSVGTYSLSTTDIASCPPGDYTFEITGTIGT